MNPRQNLGQIQAQQVADLVAQRVVVHGQFCPSCGQLNAKVSLEWSCQRIVDVNLLCFFFFT